MTTTTIVPKIIHQTWKTHDNIPSKWAKSPVEWKRHHPTWTYRLWSDDDLRNLVKSSYPNFLEIYDSFPYPIQRVDTARYMILDQFGGVYSDLDIYPTGPIDEFVGIGASAYFVHSVNVKVCITNSLMASVPGAPVWKHVLAEIAKRNSDLNNLTWLARVTKHMHIMETTGPMVLDYAIRNANTPDIGTLGMLPQGRMPVNADDDSDEEGGPTVVSRKRACMETPTDGGGGALIVGNLHGGSWCSFDSHVLSWIFRHQLGLSVFGCVVGVLLFIALIIFVIRSLGLKRRLTECVNRCRGFKV